MYQEFRNFLKIQNLLLENSNLVLNETTEIANIILSTIEKYNKEMKNKKYKDGTEFKELEINTNIIDINKIDKGEQENTFTIETRGKSNK